MWRIACSGMLLGLVVLAGPVQAQSARQGNDGVARLQAALQQLSAEKTTLQGEKTKLETHVAELEKQLAAAQEENKSISTQLAHSQAAEQQATANGEALNEHLKQAHDRTEELVTHFRETASSLQQTERERGELQQQLAGSSQQLDLCTKNNVALYDVGIEVLDRYQSKGFWSVMKQKEPFTQLKRVEIENLAEEYRQRLDDARYVGQGNGA